MHVQSNIPNSTIVLQLTSSDPLNGTASTSAAFCDVQADGLAPLGGGPRSPADYSTACSCNALVSSHATLTNTTVVGPGFTETETATAVIDNYLPPQDCCIKCWISAADVQVFYWPIETGPSTPPNATARVINSTVAAPAPNPYSMVSDGITLSVVIPAYSWTPFRLYVQHFPFSICSLSKSQSCRRMPFFWQ